MAAAKKGAKKAPQAKGGAGGASTRATGKAAKAATKPATPKKAAPAKKAEPAKKSARAPGKVPGKVPAKKAAAAPRTPVQKTRVVIPMDFYEPHKDDIKAPFKEHTLKWNFLGEGKGLYKREDSGVHCFTQFKDDGVHYSIWGADKATCEKILGAWRKLLGEEMWVRATTSGEAAVAAEQAQQESEALKLWKLAQPQRRPGEPDLFYNKRLAEWQAKKPA